MGHRADTGFSGPKSGKASTMHIVRRTLQGASALGLAASIGVAALTGLVATSGSAGAVAIMRRVEVHGVGRQITLD